jgi:hypothetical protein
LLGALPAGIRPQFINRKECLPSMSRNSKKRRDAKKAQQKSSQNKPPSTQSSQAKAPQNTAGSGKPSQKQPVKKQRGTALTIALVLVTLGAIIDAIVPLLYRKTTYEITHPVVLGGVIVMALLGVAGVVGMWLWKRWGIYLFLASVAVSIGVGLVIYPVLWAAFHAMIPLLILGYGLSIDNKRALFD